MSNKKPARREEDEAAVVDRLSDLPDEIIHKVLRFLGINYAVQTCVLSKRWERLWASNPDLIFPLAYYKNGKQALMKFVHQVLSRRDDCSIREFYFFTRWILDQNVWESVINYAVSHYARELFILSDDTQEVSLPPALLTCKSLAILVLLRLKFAALPESFGFSCSNLTTLDLHRCHFCQENKGDGIIWDPFSGCPKLTHLCIRHCVFPPALKGLKISGLQLRVLQIEGMGHGNSGLPKDCRVEIFAPKVASFWFEKSYGAMNSSGLCLPSLNFLEIALWSSCSEKTKVNSDLINMFQGLANASTVKLNPEAIEILDWFPASLEQRPSPFKRLEVLKVVSNSDSFTIPSHVLKYFLGSTPPAEPSHLEYVKHNQKVVKVLCYKTMLQGPK